MSPTTSCLACGHANLEPWTKTRDVEYFTLPDTFALLRCQVCDALSIDPIPDDRLDLIYPPTYYSFSGESVSFVARVKKALDRRRFGRLLSTLPGDAIHVLDVGGGSGWLLQLVRSADPRVIRTQVVDFDVGAEQIALQHGHDFFRGRIEDFETERRFQLILLLNLIEHVKDPTAVLKKARRLLAPNGVILLQTPNWRCIDERLFRRADWGGYHTPRHWVLFTRESLHAAATRAGLRIRRFSYTQGGWFWAVSLLGTAARRGWLDASREVPINRHPLFGPTAGFFAALDFARLPFMSGSQMVCELEADTQTTRGTPLPR